MDSILEYIAARLQEPSTWASLGSLATAVGFVIAPEYWQAIAAVGLGLGGLLGTLLRERKKTTATEIKSVVQAVVKPDAVKPIPPPVSTLEATMKAAS